MADPIAVAELLFESLRRRPAEALSPSKEAKALMARLAWLFLPGSSGGTDPAGAALMAAAALGEAIVMAAAARPAYVMPGTKSRMNDQAPMLAGSSWSQTIESAFG